MARSERDREQIAGALRRELVARPEVVLALLHGSFSKGGAFAGIQQRTFSGLDDRFRYALDLSVHLQLQLGSPIDVRVLNDASLAFRYHALQGRPLLTRDDEFLDELRARTWDDYLDFQPFAREYLRAVLSE